MENETITDWEKEKTMEWDEWYAKYQPVMFDAFLDDGEPLEFTDCKAAADWISRNWDHVAEEDIAKHVWTCTSGDGWCYTSTGFHVVDRMHCYVCKVPWVDLYEACMYDGSMDNYIETISEDCYDDDDESGCVWEGDWSGR